MPCSSLALRVSALLKEYNIIGAAGYKDSYSISASELFDPKVFLCSGFEEQDGFGSL
jgi:hypothetical protein